MTHAPRTTPHAPPGPDEVYLTDIDIARRRAEYSAAIAARDKLILIAAIQDAKHVGHKRIRIHERSGMTGTTLDKYLGQAPVEVPPLPEPPAL